MTEESQQPPPPPPAPSLEEKIPILSLRPVCLYLSLFWFLLITGLSGFAYWSIYEDNGVLDGEKIVVIQKGKRVTEIGEILHSEQVLSSDLFFRLAVYFLANDNLQAGEYLFKPAMTMADVIERLRKGLVIIHQVTIPEGLTSAEIVSLLKETPNLTGDAPALPPEGSLMPDSYRYTYGEKRETILARMQKLQKEVVSALWETRAPNLPLKDINEALTLASLIEKETGIKASERVTVAGVFYNRLRIGMRLQSDPTVIYAIEKTQAPLNRPLQHQDLDFPSPFNTYENAGLPPAPICNPGRAAIDAALHPEENDYLYFVADGTGGHVFSKDLKEHNRNVQNWNKIKKNIN